MAADDKDADQKSSDSSKSDAEVAFAKRLAKGGTFIGLGTLQKASSVAASAEAESRKDSDSDKTEAPAAEAKKPHAHEAAPASARKTKATSKRADRAKRREAQGANANATKASEERVRGKPAAREEDRADEVAPPVATKSLAGAVVWVPLIGVVLAGAWWLTRSNATADSTSSTSPPASEPAKMMERPAPPISPTSPTVAEAPAQNPAPEPSVTSEPPAKVETQPAHEPPQVVPVAASKNEGVVAARHVDSSELAPKSAALVAISRNSNETRRCRRKPDPAGTAQVQVTFESTGQVSNVRVAAPYAATHTGQCLVERLREIKIAPFSGNKLTVRAPIELY
jgi:hypothetical protein